MKLKFLLFTLLISLTIQLSAAEYGKPFEENPELKVELSVYPNPSTGIFYLTIESETQQTLEVQLVNLIGQPVARQKVASNQETKFDLSDKPKGFYFLKVKSGNKEMIKRVIIQ